MKIEDYAEKLKDQLGGDWKKAFIAMLKIQLKDLELEAFLTTQTADEDHPEFKDIVKPLQLIVTCAFLLGWDIAAPFDDKYIDGMIIGSTEYLKKVLKDVDSDDRWRHPNV